MVPIRDRKKTCCLLRAENHLETNICQMERHLLSACYQSCAVTDFGLNVESISVSSLHLQSRVLLVSPS